MKKLVKLMVLFTIVPAFFLSSCKKSEEEANEFLTLKTYMVDNGMDLGSIITNADGAKFVMAAKEGTELTGKYVIDIRTAEKFAEGHIDGAHNVAFGDILTAAAAADAAGQAPVIVCYTGQTACYATSLLRLAGYSNAQALKWGMSGWSDETDSWTGNIADIAKDNSNWSYDAAPALAAYASPLVVTGEADGAAMLQARIEAVIAEGFKGVASADVLATPGNYFINNFFSETDYAAFGHIAGAQRISPLSLSNVENLDPDATICTYCYTGQTSAVITAYLRVLGYDAVSLKFGMNSMYNSNEAWASNQWGGDSNSKHFELVK
ncbi:MAG: rhodanese-like domain-containing protein [Prolixibacteraceae bacterium]|jgi:rhodanese-related sulfurtransferase|nr:rhodanese-like domain-containing protein [Prolixibacteraceae bacterium]